MNTKSLNCEELNNIVSVNNSLNNVEINFSQYKCLNDNHLIRFFVENEDEHAFNELVNRHGERIYRTAYRITGDHEASEDILQNVFVILFEKLHKFRNESKFTTWLFRVTSNASYMYLRSANRINGKELHLEDLSRFDESGNLADIHLKDASEIPDKNALRKEAIELMDKAINELPAKYRKIFHLRDIEGLSNQEVSEITGLSLPAVKSRILRARNFLKEKLSDYYYEYN
ncbi:MAG: sigma-70 family RNA polymerase sigma factor [Candidatus Dadabacteria bacterium]|nr:sigma-70 family RNA polymerase sigma factor [Candidatus Dadabacteria bacterium]NIQ15476.1 sigma-70 family RNA polymerase sigma factor [Candidatus Dadabacteria bacterium]